MEAAIVMASAVPEGRDRGSQRQSLEMKNHPCKVRTADGPRVAGRCATKEDFESRRVGSTPAVSCARSLPTCDDHAAESTDLDERAGLQVRALRLP